MECNLHPRRFNHGAGRLNLSQETDIDTLYTPLWQTRSKTARLIKTHLVTLTTLRGRRQSGLTFQDGSLDVRSVLILGNYRPSYILARAFHNRGYRVICDMEGYELGAEVSRYVDALWPHAPYAKDPLAFQTRLTNFLARHPEIEWVCPVTEPLIKAFAKAQLTLPEQCKLLNVEGDLVNRCLNKEQMLKLAQDLKVPVAPFAITSNADELFDRAEEIGFPLVVRPQSSSHRLAGQKAVTVTSLEDLTTSFESWKDETTDLLIQRHASGKRDNIYFAAQNGVIERYLHAKILRTDQADGSSRRRGSDHFSLPQLARPK